MSSPDSQSATFILESIENAERLQSRAALLEGSVLLAESVGHDLLSENVDDAAASTPPAVNGDFSPSAIVDEVPIPVENRVVGTGGSAGTNTLSVDFSYQSAQSFDRLHRVLKLPT